MNAQYQRTALEAHTVFLDSLRNQYQSRRLSLSLSRACYHAKAPGECNFPVWYSSLVRYIFILFLSSAWEDASLVEIISKCKWPVSTARAAAAAARRASASQVSRSVFSRVLRGASMLVPVAVSYRCVSFTDKKFPRANSPHSKTVQSQEFANDRVGPARSRLWRE